MNRKSPVTFRVLQAIPTVNTAVSIHEVAERGCCVIVVSSELPEVLGISDRVIVMREGAICGELARADASETEVLRLALPDSTAPAPAAAHIETAALPTRSIA